MSEYITSDGAFNIYDFVDKYVERVSRTIDERALEKLERELAEYGYVKVVRCRDCEWYIQANSMTGWNDVCNLIDINVQSNGFCAWAKRKESGE